MEGGPASLSFVSSCKHFIHAPFGVIVQHLCLRNTICRLQLEQDIKNGTVFLTVFPTVKITVKYLFFKLAFCCNLQIVA